MRIKNKSTKNKKSTLCVPLSLVGKLRAPVSLITVKHSLLVAGDKFVLTKFAATIGRGVTKNLKQKEKFFKIM